MKYLPALTGASFRRFVLMAFVVGLCALAGQAALVTNTSDCGSGTSRPRGWLGEREPEATQLPAVTPSGHGELFFIDADIADPGAFRLAAPAGATVVCVPAGVDAWNFMAVEAGNYRNLRALHLVSHGEPGALTLNRRRYTAADLAARATALQQLGHALSRNGDLLVYGCDTGAGAEGARLVATLSEFTGADVAASSNLTGGLAGADWNLETTSGAIETSAMAPAGYAHALFTATVTTVTQLKDAIDTGSADNAADTITLDNDITFTSADDAITINVADGKTMSIVGGGHTLSGANLARVLYIGTNSSVVISNLTITGGYLMGADGGIGLAGGDSLGAGIHNAGTLTLRNCTISGNRAAGGGGGGGSSGFTRSGGLGGIASNGTISITGRSGISGANSGTAGRGGDAAAGIFNSGSMYVSGSSTITGNVAAGGGGGGGGTIIALGGRGVGGVWNTGSFSITSACFAAIATNFGTNADCGVDGSGRSTGPLVPGPDEPDIRHTGTLLDQAYAPPIAPPSVGNLDGDSVAFTEGDSALLVDAGDNATVTDTDSANFSGGNVTVSIVTNHVWGEDVLSIRHQGTGAGQIGVSGGNVSYAGVTIGTFTGGSNGNSLVVTLNANSTPTNVGALLRNLTYHNTNTAAPSTNARTVRVTVNDGAGGTSVAPVPEVRVTLTAVNDAPTWSGLPTDVTVLEDTLSNFDLSACTLSDPDAGTGSMTLTLTASAGTLSATSGGGITAGDSGTGTLTLAGTLANLNTFIDTGAAIKYTGATNAAGDNAATVTVKLNDGGNTGTGGALETPLGTVNVDITAVNDAPTLDAIANPTAILEDAGQQTINLSGISAGAGETQTLSVTASSNNPALIPHPTVTYTSPNATGSLSYTPVADANGSAVITVTVTDHGGVANGGVEAFSRTFTVTVTAVTDAPTLSTISTLTGAIEDTPFTITFAALADVANESDADGDTLLFRVETVSSGTLTQGGLPVVAGTTLLGTGGSLVWTPAADANGTLDAFTVKAWDGTVASATAVQVRATVAAVTDAPTVTGAATAEDTQTASGLVVAKNTADGAEVTHFKITAITGGRLYQTNGTTEIANGGFITIAEGGDGLKFTPALNKNTAAGDSFTFNVQAANDGAGTGLSAGAATATITVTSVNDAPTDIALSANSIRRSAAANATIGTLSTTDVDTGDTFTYTLVSGTGDTDNASFNLSGATLRANNPQALIGGARSVRVRSTDAGGLWCEKVFSITVEDDLLVVGSNLDSGPGSLRKAIADLPAGGVISFALDAGEETISLASDLVITKSLTIDGRNTAGSSTPVTLQVTTPGSSPWRVMRIQLTAGKTVTLQGLVLKGGDVRGLSPAYGGVLASEGGGLNLTDVTVRDGVATGGAGLFTASTLRAIRCTFTGNAAVGTTGSVGGGGLYAADQPTVLIHCTIVGNTCQTDAGSSQGGGVYCDGPISIINSTITGNTVSGAAPTREGGGVYNRTGSLQVLNSIVVGNQAATGADITTGTAPAGTTNGYYSWFGGVSGTTIGTQVTAPNQTTAYSAGQLSALGNYGGTTQTVRVNAGAPAIGHGAFVYDNGSYWFLATDGAYHRLDAYATTVAVEPTGKIGTDQRGIVRTSPSTIGAYQVGLNVTGTITRAGGAVFSGVSVSNGTRTTTTDTTGNFVLGDVPPGTYTLTPSYPGYTFTPSSRSVVVSGTDISGADFVAAPVPEEKSSQTITFTPLGNAVVGEVVTLSASASSGLPVTFSLVSGPATLSGSAVTCTGIGVVTVRTTQSGNDNFLAATPVEQSFTVGLPTPTVTTPTQVPTPAVGEDAVLTVPQTSAGLTYQWQRNGENLANATHPTLTLPDVQPPAAGLYTYTASTAGGTAAVSEPVIVGVATEDKVTGTGELVGADIRHPNGNVYDQLILEGDGATFTAEPAQVTRMSYVDLSGDIVQVEFSGAGSLSLVMDDAGTPAPAANYNQPGVNYVRGNPGIVITGADETTNVSVISVGRINAVNQSLFRDDVTYDGVANIAFIAIQSTNGQFGGVRTGNVEYFAAQGFTGVYAPGVTFNGPVNIGDIQAHDDAQPLLVVGSAANVRIAGGSLAQPNGQPIRVDGLTQVTMAPGQTSQGGALPAQANQGVLQQDGVDVTDLIVMKP